MVASLHDCAQPLAILYKLTCGKSTDFNLDEESKKAFDDLIKIALHPSQLAIPSSNLYQKESVLSRAGTVLKFLLQLKIDIHHLRENSWEQ